MVWAFCPFDQLNWLNAPPLAANWPVTLTHKADTPEMLTCGCGGMVAVCWAVPTQPAALVTVTVKPPELVAVTLEVVAPFDH